MIILGITGSIGMGKTTASHILRTLGVPVHDSDTAVHDMFIPQSVGFGLLTKAFPRKSYKDIYTKNGVIERGALGRIVFNDAAERKKLESITHPFVRNAQDNFLRKHRTMGLKTVGLDIPLLFETGADRRVDYTVVVSAPAYIQKSRVLARANMTAKKFDAILAVQMPSHEKCARADFVVQTGIGMAHSVRALKNVLHTLRSA